MPKMRTKKDVLKRLSDIERYINHVDYQNVNLNRRLSPHFDTRAAINILDASDKMQKHIYLVRMEVQKLKKLLE